MPLNDAVSPDSITNSVKVLLPLTVSRFAPGPIIVKESPAAGLMLTVEASVIVRGVLNDESKTIVSEPAAAFESKIACRKLPAPLLLVFDTVKVAAAPVAAQVKIKAIAAKPLLKIFIIARIIFLL